MKKPPKRMPRAAPLPRSVQLPAVVPPLREPPRDHPHNNLDRAARGAFGDQDTALVSTCCADIIGTQSLSEFLNAHDFTGIISRARLRSSASRVETGTVSFARSFFQADRSIITSSTVSK